MAPAPAALRWARGSCSDTSTLLAVMRSADRLWHAGGPLTDNESEDHGDTGHITARKEVRDLAPRREARLPQRPVYSVQCCIRKMRNLRIEELIPTALAIIRDTVK